jgi:argininosuccinate lyase
LEELSKGEYAQCGIDANDELYRSLSLHEVLAVHDVPGGTAPLRVRAALAEVKEKLSIFAGVAHACT